MLLILHGGAGGTRPSRKAMDKLRGALEAGFDMLKKGASALDAVVESITILEDSVLFNAGAGGSLQLDGVRRLDAALMEGALLRAGSVIGLEGIRNPIKAARAVMDLPHVMLTNKGARMIAVRNKLSLLPKPDEKALGRLETLKKT